MAVGQFQHIAEGFFWGGVLFWKWETGSPRQGFRNPRLALNYFVTGMTLNF